jgi:hypothetical protein
VRRFNEDLANTETSGWQPEGYRKAFDEMAEKFHSCSDAYRYPVLIQGWKRKNWQGEAMPEIYLKWFV